jgi:hypothetical protein
MQIRKDAASQLARSAVVSRVMSMSAAVSRTAPLSHVSARVHRRRLSRASTRATTESSTTSSSSTSSSPTPRVGIVGAHSSTGRLLVGLLSARVGGANVAVVSEVLDGFVPDDMPEDIFVKRFGTTRAEMEKCVVVDESAAEEVEKTISECDVVILAHENGAKAAVAASVVGRGASKAKRVVALSRVGVNRRGEKPFDEQNKPMQKMVQVGQMNLPIGGDVDGSKGVLDSFAEAEATLAEASEKVGFDLTVVRSGQLRGNGPLLLSEYSARLVDNMYDVKFQDLYVKRGDTSEGYTKRLNLAQFMCHVSTTRMNDAPEDVEVLSVVTKTNFFGEQTLTPPTDRERRKGYDMAKGKAPAAIDVSVIEELLSAI